MRTLTLQPCSAQSHSSRLHHNAPEAEGEPSSFVQQQEVQAFGLEAEEDQGTPQSTDPLPGESQDSQRDQKTLRIPDEEVCPQGVESYLVSQIKIKASTRKNILVGLILLMVCSTTINSCLEFHLFIQLSKHWHFDIISVIGPKY